MKKLSYLFTALALILSHAMCATVAYIYREILCAIEHYHTSFPANTAFLYAIPFLIPIIVLVILAIIFHKKSK